MDTSVQELLDLEWRLFDAAPQVGQWPARPEDREMFCVTRSAELSVWSPKLRESWRHDLLSAQAEGRNPINEKYIYMLKGVDQERYASLKADLPEADIEKLWLVDWICQAEINWQEVLMQKYPRLTKNSRAIRKSTDSPEGVSFETYLRGELMPCSVITLRLYASQIEKAQKAGKNLCEDILENMVRQLGYESLEIAEDRMTHQAE